MKPKNEITRSLLIDKETWEELKLWITTNVKPYDKIDVLGSGGNINKIFKISGKTMGKPLTYFYLTSLFPRPSVISSLSSVL